MSQERMAEGNPLESVGEDQIPTELENFLLRARQETHDVHPEDAGSTHPKNIEAILPTSLDARSSRSTLMERIRKLPTAVRGSIPALALAGEVALAEALPKDKEGEYTTVESKKEEPHPTSILFGKDHVFVGGDAFGIFVKHNIRKPETVGDVGKMFYEPLSFGFKFQLQNESWPIEVKTGNESREGQPTIISVDIPFEYAQDFNKATPADKQKMEKDMEKKARILIDRILPVVIPLFSSSASNVGNIGYPGSKKIREMRIGGFASGEAEGHLDKNDPRNQRLSELRAENAAYVLQTIFERNGIAVETIKYRGEGELHLSPPERTDLLNDAFQMKIGASGMPEDERILALINRYNKGSVSRDDIREEMDRIVGGKRKVAIGVATNRDFVLVIPIPLVIPILFGLLKKERPHAVYAHFVSGPKQQPYEKSSERIGTWDLSRSLRKKAAEPTRRRDVIKGYAGSEEPLPQYRDDIVESAPHRRKRKLTGREKVELDFDPNVPEEERVGALAFVIDRYLRMTPDLMNERNAIGMLRPGKRNYDLVNIYKNPGDLLNLLNQILVETVIIDDKTELRPLSVPVSIPKLTDSPVQFEFRSDVAHRNLYQVLRFPPRQLRAGIAARREDVNSASVVVNGKKFQINRKRLSELADKYMISHDMRIRPRDREKE